MMKLKVSARAFALIMYWVATSLFLVFAADPQTAEKSGKIVQWTQLAEPTSFSKNHAAVSDTRPASQPNLSPAKPEKDPAKEPQSSEVQQHTLTDQHGNDSQTLSIRSEKTHPEELVTDARLAPRALTPKNKDGLRRTHSEGCYEDKRGRSHASLQIDAQGKRRGQSCPPSIQVPKPKSKADTKSGSPPKPPQSTSPMQAPRQVSAVKPPSRPQNSARLEEFKRKCRDRCGKVKNDAKSFSSWFKGKQKPPKNQSSHQTSPSFKSHGHRDRMVTDMLEHAGRQPRHPYRGTYLYGEGGGSSSSSSSDDERMADMSAIDVAAVEVDASCCSFECSVFEYFQGITERLGDICESATSCCTTDCCDEDCCEEFCKCCCAVFCGMCSL